MAKKKNNNNNYLKLGLIVFGVVIFVVIFANIYLNIMNNRISNSYISKYVSSIQYNELDIARTEFSGDTFLYISYTGDKQIRSLEMKLKKVIEESELSDKFIHIDMFEEMKKENYLSNLNDTLELSDMKIKALPAIIYYKDNNVIEIIDSEDNLLNSGDFSQLLDKYELAS